MNGRLGAYNLLSDTTQAVYVNNNTDAAFVTINICNRNWVSTKISIAVSTSTSPIAPEYIESGTELLGKGVLERTGVAVGPGQYIVAKSTEANVNVVVYGVEMGVASVSPITITPNTAGNGVDFITPLTLPVATAGTAYSQSLAGLTPKTETMTYTVTTGGVPAGLTLDSATGILSGTPTSGSGTATSFTVTATDNNGNQSTRNHALTVGTSGVVATGGSTFIGYSPPGYAVRFNSERNDYLTSSNLNCQLTGDFTVEAWVYPYTWASYQRVISGGNNGTNYWTIGFSTTWTGNLKINWYDGTDYYSSDITPVQLNTWYHLAVSRVGTTITYYVNGVAYGTTTSYSNNPGNSTGGFSIGRRQAATEPFNGLISNVRVTVGAAVYTAAFVPTTIPFGRNTTNLVDFSTYDSVKWVNGFPSGATLTTGIDAPDGTNTAVRLACNNSTNARLRVTHGSITPTGTDSYTISFYVRKISGTTGTISADWGDLTPTGTYSSQLVTGSWVRVSYTATSTAVARTYIDLLNDSTNNYTLDFWGLQIEKSASVSTYVPTPANFRVSPLFLACQGTNHRPTDAYAEGGAVNLIPSGNYIGPYMYQTSQYSEFYSNLFAAGEYINVPASSATYSPGTGDVTIEGWFLLTSLSATVGLWGCNNGAGGNPKMTGYVESNGTLHWDITSAGGASQATSTSGVIVANRWYHIAWVRASSVAYLYVNGTQVATGAATGNLSSLTNPFQVGYIGEGSANFPGYISNFRYTKAAIYTSAFTPSRSALGALTTNLLNFSDQFNVTSAWTVSAATVSANSTNSPDGTLTADKLVESVTTAQHYVYATRTGSSETVTLSVYAKVAERTKIQLQLSNNAAATAEVIFDLVAGTAGSASSANADYTNISGSIVFVSNGWYRCTLTATKGSVNTNNYSTISTVNAAGSASYTGDGASGLFIWGAQLETNSIATTYVPTPTNFRTAPVLLTCQSPRFRDTSTTAAVVSIASGTPKVESFGPFGSTTNDASYKYHMFIASDTFVPSTSGWVELIMWGCGGGGGRVGGWGQGFAGGGGAYAYGQYFVTSGVTYQVVVGTSILGTVGAGTALQGGFAHCGNGSDNSYGAAGGGFSGFFVSTTINQTNAILIAAGGGGGGSSRTAEGAGGSCRGGAGGELVGENGRSDFDSKFSQGGGGGTQFVSPAIGGNAGGALVGGTTSTNSYGGGGGGGWFGGAGGAYSESNSMAGGGGGSSYIGNLSNAILARGASAIPGNYSDPLRKNFGIAPYTTNTNPTGGIVYIRYTAGS